MVPSRVHLKHLPEGMVSDISQSSPLLSASGFSEVSSDTIRPGFGAKIAEVTTALCASERQSNFDFFITLFQEFVHLTRIAGTTSSKYTRISVLVAIR